jgi:hypothetical protein
MGHYDQLIFLKIIINILWFDQNYTWLSSFEKLQFASWTLYAC